jgi:hypothetical protein
VFAAFLAGASSFLWHTCRILQVMKINADGTPTPLPDRLEDVKFSSE